MGVVYHAHVLDWFEAARTEALRAMGAPYKSLEERGLIMPVVEATVRYHASLYYDDVAEIRVWFAEAPRVRLPLDYAVRREGDAVVCVSGRVTLCCVDTERRRPVPVPDEIRALASHPLGRPPAADAGD